MDNDFQPLYEEKDSEAFNIWEIKKPEPESTIEIDEQEEFVKECDRLREEAKNRGYQEGVQLAESELQLKRQELNKWINLIQQPVVLLDNLLSQELVQTILWVCETCIDIELSIHPEKLLVVVEEIKKELPSLQGDKQLAMNPLDIQWLLNEFKEQKNSELTALLVADSTLTRGDFYLKNEYSELDGRLKTRLQKIFKSLLSEDEIGDKIKNKDSQ